MNASIIKMPAVEEGEITPTVTIFSLVFNHEKFLRECLDGFVMQKTNFAVEVLIHDDASTDESANIIREYMEKYPHIQWRPFFQEENQYSQGKLKIHNVLKHVRSKYLAFCEGDDYWTDPDKLQKQVDFLEENPDFSICFHQVSVCWNNKEQPDELFPSDKMVRKCTEWDIDYLLKGNFIQTCSVMYRWCFDQNNNQFEERFPHHIIPIDYMLHLFHAKQGKIKLLKQCMGVYRRHEGGIWFEAAQTDDFYLKNAIPLLNFEQNKNRLFCPDAEKRESEYMHDIIMACVVKKNWALLEQVEALFPEKYARTVEPLSKSNRLVVVDRYIQGMTEALDKKGAFYQICKLLFRCYRQGQRLFK